MQNIENKMHDFWVSASRYQSLEKAELKIVSLHSEVENTKA